MIDHGSGPHPSYLALDRLALGAPDAATTEAHVAACDRCRQYIGGLRQIPALPAGLRERIAAVGSLAPPRADGAFRRWLAARRWRVFSVTGLAGAAALATAVLWFGSHPESRRAPPSATGYDGTKGLPSVWIYVKHDSELALWDGERPLAPGDRLRLKIDPQDLTHVDVFTREEAGKGGARADGGALVAVFSSHLPHGAITALPAAWQIDGSGRPESLIVVLAKRAVSAADAKRFVETGAPADVWLRRFQLRPVGPGPRPAEPLP